MATDNFKRFGIPTALVIGGVTAGSLFAPIGLASAQDADSETDPDTTVAPEESTEDGEREGRRGHRGRHFGAKADVLTEALGLDAEEIRAGFEEGKTIADMAAEQNVAVDDVEAALVAAANERIDEAVEDGRLDEAEADEKRAEIEERVENLMTQDPSEFQGRKGHRGHRGHRGVRGFGSEVVQETLGLSAEEIRDGIQEGKTLSELAAEQDVSIEDLAAAMVGAAEERIDEAVESGKIDADVAEEKLAELEERIEGALNGELPERDGEGRRGRGFGGQGFRGQRGGDTADTADAAVEDIEDASF